ncbi:hypothetical protein TNIN_461411 [Trichonephila inaurata madagascariensis]|uniref:SPOC domain-containing protein n=1 Tax=Trichonephila inaurata madagascariensis TaxID=2747483 RepID=A0A8X7C249_9ARAC|nr:hypothetical protein TNIN_461411 [Trichonephila inaurata madagascariensis]
MSKKEKLDDAVLIEFIKRYPVVWRGNLVLKDAQAMVMMHCISGDVGLAISLLRGKEVDPTEMRITHVKSLETEGLKEIIQRIKITNKYCVLLAIPCSTKTSDTACQRRRFRSYFHNFLKDQKYMGIVKGTDPETNQPAYVMYMFPQCELANCLIEDMPMLKYIKVNRYLSSHLIVVLRKK